MPLPILFRRARMRMRRLIPVIIAAVFALSALAAGCANEKLPARPQPPKKETAATEKNGAPKPRVKVFTGTIVAVDEKAGTLTLKGPKREMEFQVGKNVKKQLDGLRIGDKLIVKHVDETALSIVKLHSSSSALGLEEKKLSRGETDPSRVAQ